MLFDSGENLSRLLSQPDRYGSLILKQSGCEKRRRDRERERERERRGCGLRLSLRERGIKKFLSGRRFITYSCVRATGTLCEGWQLAQRGSSFYSPRSRPQIPQTSRDKLCSFLRLSVSLSLSLSLSLFFHGPVVPVVRFPITNSGEIIVVEDRKNK